MKKLALVVPSLNKGGGVPAVARFVKDAALRSGRYELKLVSLCVASKDPCSLQLSKPSSWLKGVRTVTDEWAGLPFAHVGAVFGEFEFQRYRTRRALSEILAECDLVQVVCGSPAWANAVVGQGKPVALQVATRAIVERRQRDANLKWPIDWWRRLMTKITDRLDDQALCSVNAVQAENLWMFEYARKMNVGRAIDIRYATPGINTDLYQPLPHRDVTTAPYIFCVGRFQDPRKNIGLLVCAYALLPDAVRSCVRLVLAGSSPPPDSFWAMADFFDVRDRVQYIASPSREELIRLYQEASIFALPSDEEGLGMVILEAMSCAVPVVATRCGGPEGIIRDGEDGFLVPLDDAKAMAGRLKILLEKDAINIEMGHKARKTVESRFDEKIAGAVFVDMWDRLIEKKMLAAKVK